MRINHNIAALNTYRQYNTANAAQSKSMEKLSSGLRINSASDDAAGLAISEKMRGQVRGLDQAARNAQDGISVIQTAEGALGETHDILQRMRELAVQSSNDSNTDADRGEIQKEVNQLAKEVTRIANDTEFNTKKLLTGAVDSSNTTNVTDADSMTFQIGANAGQSINLDIKAMDAVSLGVAGTDTSNAVAAGTADTAKAVTNDGIDVSSKASASTAITAIESAIEKVSAERSNLGAHQNRLDHSINNLNTSSENLTAAESRVRDVDMAKEMMEQTKNSILAQASQAMLSQANQQPQQVLQLLR
ncbi:flagellin Hag [Priestia megaterium]|jgi:flagellin|uniref:flagellin Hag n=1 Tax=Priestia TaxID=2800373 RepID=UPI002453256A|nr:flagellin Hag [Priestia megaterium]MDH3143690.1 flagellin Hag [Priestia megaterium]MDP1382062.1 flagellin Hag [Priestia megaterium]MDP1422700.1 flagellin Hag [Priestia megaterium]MED4236360.1 flagellin Hag [Priestia megaterium]MED4254007.1 flagellin Hag [Priestia megaterium]